MKAKEYFKIYGAAMANEVTGKNDAAFKEVTFDMMDHMYQDMAEEHRRAVLDAEGTMSEDDLAMFAQKKYVKLLRSYNQKWNAVRSMCKKQYGIAFIAFDGYLSTVLHFITAKGILPDCLE